MREQHGYRAASSNIKHDIAAARCFLHVQQRSCHQHGQHNRDVKPPHWRGVFVGYYGAVEQGIIDTREEDDGAFAHSILQ